MLQITTGKNDKGLKLYDPGYLNTAPVRSSICYIDGDEGILRYRGYPIEELADGSSFLEVAYLLSKHYIVATDFCQFASQGTNLYVHLHQIPFSICLIYVFMPLKNWLLF